MIIEKFQKNQVLNKKDNKFYLNSELERDIATIDVHISICIFTCSFFQPLQDNKI